PGIASLLDALDARGMPMAVLSNKPDDGAQAMVQALFPSRFRFVLGRRDGFPPKPAPDSALKVADELGIRPAEGLLRGESEYDRRAAKRAGLRSIACTWGFRQRPDLLAEAPDGLIDTPGALLDHLV